MGNQMFTVCSAVTQKTTVWSYMSETQTSSILASRYQSKAKKKPTFLQYPQSRSTYTNFIRSVSVSQKHTYKWINLPLLEKEHECWQQIVVAHGLPSDIRLHHLSVQVPCHQVMTFSVVSQYAGKNTFWCKTKFLRFNICISIKHCILNNHTLLVSTQQNCCA